MVLRDRFHQLRGSDHVNQLAGGHLDMLAQQLVADRGAPVTPENLQMAREYLQGGGMGQFDQQQATESAIADQIMATETAGGQPLGGPAVGVLSETSAAPAPPAAPPLPVDSGAPVLPPTMPPPDNAYALPLGAGETAVAQAPAAQGPLPVDPAAMAQLSAVPTRDVTASPVPAPISLLPTDDPSGPGILRSPPEGMERGQYSVDTPSGPYDYTLYLGENGMYNTVAPDGRRLVARTAQEIEQMLRTGAVATPEPVESRSIDPSELF